jgi:anti-sigma regulatory factor (Ser/Thr protein kinase)
MKRTGKLHSQITQAPRGFGAERMTLKAEWNIRSDLGLIDEVICNVTGLIKRSCYGDALERIDLALHEALANAIVHGNHNDSARPVRIRVGVAKDGSLLLAVKDIGAGFDPAKVPVPLGNRLMIPHGRGIFVIRELMDKVTFSFENGTEIRMSLKPTARCTSTTTPS